MIKVVAIWTLVASVVTAAMYVWDKHAATRGKRRVSERSLLLASLLGGWPGGWAASKLVRHKTIKRSFRIKFVLAAVIHVVAIGALLYWQVFSD